MMKNICYGSVIASFALAAGCIVGDSSEGQSTGSLGGQTGVVVGSNCASDYDCGSGGICLTDVPGGYCTLDCGFVEGYCGANGVCVPSARVGFSGPTILCLALCEADPRDARIPICTQPGLSCFGTIGASSDVFQVCLPD